MFTVWLLFAHNGRFAGSVGVDDDTPSFAFRFGSSVEEVPIMPVPFSGHRQIS